MTSKIQQECEKTTGVTQGRSEGKQDYFRGLAVALGKIPEKDFFALSKGAQDWYDAACDANDKRQDIPDFPDAEAEPEAPSRRRRSAEPEAAAPYAPAKGDRVTVTSKRGKSWTGTWVEVDKGMVILSHVLGEPDDAELEACLMDGATVVPAGGLAAPEEGGRRRRSAEPEAEGPRDPVVGDEVEVENMRGKVYKGKVEEITDTLLVVDKEEIARERVKSIKITKAAGGSAAVSSGKDKPDDKTRVSAKDNGGVSVTTRIKEIVAKTPDIKQDDVAAILKKENLTCKDNTLDMNFKEAGRFIKIMRDAGWKEPK